MPVVDMRLEKKQEYRPQILVKSTQRVQSSKISLSDVEMDVEVGNGKYRSKTARWISENDSSYFQWMYNSGMLTAWGLIKDSLAQSKKKYSGYVDDKGYRWIDIYEKQESCAPSEYIKD